MTYDATLQQEALAQRREIEGLLADLYDLREKRNAADRAASELAERVKQWLGLEGEREITDAERGIRAFLEERSALRYDVRSMDPGLVVWLATQGLLAVNVAALKAAKKAAPASELDEVERFAIPEVTYALKVVRA